MKGEKKYYTFLFINYINLIIFKYYKGFGNFLGPQNPKTPKPQNPLFNITYSLRNALVYVVCYS